MNNYVMTNANNLDERIDSAVMATGRLADGNARMKINYFVNSCVTLAASSSSMWATAAASTIFQFQCRPTFLQPPIPIFSCSSYKISPAFIYRIFMSLIFLDKALMLVVTRRASKIWLYLAAQPFFSLSFFLYFFNAVRYESFFQFTVKYNTPYTTSNTFLLRCINLTTFLRFKWHLFFDEL